MGFKMEFNWALKLKCKQGLNEKNLKVGKSYNFSKDEYRIYPVGVPIDLINENWEAVAKIVIASFKNADYKTVGKYKVVKIYGNKEKEVLTNYWRENIQLIRNGWKDKELRRFKGI